MMCTKAIGCRKTVCSAKIGTSCFSAAAFSSPDGSAESSIVRFLLVLHKKLEKLFIAPKVRQELHETTFVAFAAKGQRE